MFDYELGCDLNFTSKMFFLNYLQYFYYFKAKVEQLRLGAIPIREIQKNR